MTINFRSENIAEATTATQNLSKNGFPVRNDEVTDHISSPENLDTASKIIEHLFYKLELLDEKTIPLRKRIENRIRMVLTEFPTVNKIIKLLRTAEKAKQPTSTRIDLSANSKDSLERVLLNFIPLQVNEEANHGVKVNSGVNVNPGENVNPDEQTAHEDAIIPPSIELLDETISSNHFPHLMKKGETINKSVEIAVPDFMIYLAEHHWISPIDKALPIMVGNIKIKVIGVTKKGTPQALIFFIDPSSRS